MEKDNQKYNRFTYTYSAKEQAEVRKIREKYISPNDVEDKMARLRKLDASVTGTAQAFALVFGVIGALILGFGMSLCMTELGEFFELGRVASIVVGVVFGVVGGILASLAYPTYNAIVRARRKKLAPEIIRLTDELMK